MPVPLQQAAEQMLSPTRKLGGSYEEIILSSCQWRLITHC